MSTKSWAGGTIRLKWKRDARGYSVITDDPPTVRRTIIQDVDPVPMVHARGGAAREYDIAIGEVRVFVDLLRMEETEEGVLAFANDWGVLSGTSCPVDEFVDTRRQMQRAYRSRWKFSELARVIRGKKISSIDVRVDRRPKSSRLEVLWYARNLREFCWLEVLADLGGTSEISTCPSCGLFFAHSAAMGRDPTYCSKACKQSAYRKRNSSKRLKKDSSRSMG